MDEPQVQPFRRAEAVNPDARPAAEAGAPEGKGRHPKGKGKGKGKDKSRKGKGKK